MRASSGPDEEGGDGRAAAPEAAESGEDVSRLGHPTSERRLRDEAPSKRVRCFGPQGASPQPEAP
eukprot:3773390-Alexandrium_andersonii.AAC.1